MWSSILQNIKDAFTRTARYSDSGSRTDKATQQAMQEDLDRGKKLEVSNPQSSRWTLPKKEQEKRGLHQKGDYGTLYTADDIADMQVDTAKEKSVDSTAVKKIKYNPKTKELKIQYVSGGTEYSFPDVPKDVVTEFLDSPSKGKYLAHYIMPNYSINKKKEK